jgi:hypothetical protein
MSVVSVVENYFGNLGKSLIGNLKTSIGTFLKSFVENDLGALASAAVQEVEVSLPGAASVAKRDAAKQNLLLKLKTAGEDITTFSESVLNFLVETGVQALLVTAGKGAAALTTK